MEEINLPKTCRQALKLSFGRFLLFINISSFITSLSTTFCLPASNQRLVQKVQGELKNFVITN